MWRDSSSPFVTRAFVHSSIAAARADGTWVVVQTRGFHMIVIGIVSSSAIAAVLAIASSLDASPSKSSVQTTYSGADKRTSPPASFPLTTRSAPSTRSTTPTLYEPGASPVRSICADHVVAPPDGTSGASRPTGSRRTRGRPDDGSEANSTLIKAGSCMSGSGTEPVTDLRHPDRDD